MGVYKELEKMQNKTTTENGDVAFKSTLNKNLDMFGSMGAMRDTHNKVIKELFHDAYDENKLLALANMLLLRDIRGGMGERRVFKVMLEELIRTDIDKALSLVPAIIEIGRWDDLLAFEIDDKGFKEVATLIKKQLEKDLESDSPSLCAKWMPSENASSDETKRLAKKMREAFAWTPKEYRKTLSTIRKKLDLVENKLRENDYENINYSSVPSKAMKKYMSAFFRNDEKGMGEYMKGLLNGSEKVNVNTLHPHEIISKIWLWDAYTEEELEQELQLINHQWNSIDRSEIDSKTIVVRDGSYSMYGLPMLVATALAILTSEQLSGEFKDKFITFSAEAELVSLANKKTIEDKVNYTRRFNDMSNTNIMNVYKLIFSVLKDSPETEVENIIIISDMQFDMGVDGVPTYNSLKEMFDSIDRPVPNIAYWDVNSPRISFPTTDLEYVKLVSGFSDKILKSVLTSNVSNAVDFMLETLEPYIKVLEDDF